MPDSQEPVACSLEPGELRARQSNFLVDLAPHLQSANEAADGYELVFGASSELLRKLTAVIDAERVCCRFLKFELVVEPAGGPIRLRLSGPPGTREFLAGLIAS